MLEEKQRLKQEKAEELEKQEKEVQLVSSQTLLLHVALVFNLNTYCNLRPEFGLCLCLRYIVQQPFYVNGMETFLTATVRDFEVYAFEMQALVPFLKAGHKFVPER